MNYSKTVCLPQTAFPMKADLPKREPGVLEFWRKNRVYEKMLEQSEGRPLYVLHDGPPYANGHIHIGTALNKILKDISVKSRAMSGFRTPFVPGWDCHGLPIEQQLLKELKLDKRDIRDVALFRRQAEEFARKYIAIQSEEFQRLGVLADWRHPYTTMDFAYEAAVLRAFRLLLKGGHIYRGKKPIYWCLHCETALAEAEIEYKDKTSPSIFVEFPVKENAPFEADASEPDAAVIWTTTPWTLPANVALAFHPELDYARVRVKRDGQIRRWIVARPRLQAVLEATQAVLVETLGSYPGARFEKMLCRSPLGLQDSVGVLAGYVSAEDGTGIVHTAPGHGEDDYATGQKYGLPVLSPVTPSGRFTAEAGPLENLQVYKANPVIVQNLADSGRLAGVSEIQHSYPHCWRCKKPVIFRATEQWFLSVSRGSLRRDLLQTVAQVRWLPEASKARISNMLQLRPDWCISRQRVWGTPIPILYCRACGRPLLEDAALKHIEDKVARGGDAFWFHQDPREFLPAEIKCACGGADFKKEMDILDVWVDSGASWLGVLKPSGHFPADLYMEGHDQHRGWFQASLVPSVCLEERAPYRTVFTHGFVMDEQGKAMHKSLGNVVSPQEITGRLGADVLRLWITLSDYTADVRLSEKLLEGPVDTYRKIRNTLRFLLGNTSDFSPKDDAVAHDRMPELERYLLHRLYGLAQETKKHYQDYRFRAAARAVTDFCINDLSSFYLDARKDCLYTFPKNSEQRRAAQTVLWETLGALLKLLAPILSYTAEEAWQTLRQEHGAEQAGPMRESIFLESFPECPGGWLQEELASFWGEILKIREKILQTLEDKRRGDLIGSSLEAKVTLTLGRPHAGILDYHKKRPIDWPAITITSQFSLLEADGAAEPAVEVAHASGKKCARCWRWQETVGSEPRHPELCDRCLKAVDGLPDAGVRAGSPS